MPLKRPLLERLPDGPDGDSRFVVGAAVGFILGLIVTWKYTMLWWERGLLAFFIGLIAANAAKHLDNDQLRRLPWWPL